MKKKLYSWVCFNKQGNLRSFSSGFSKTESKEMMMDDLEKGYIIIEISSLGELPPKFLEGWYHKFSTNNDLAEFLNI
jgi:hypothetical protein